MSQQLIDINQRTEWFRHDRFGMFIHWGLYSIPGKGEWLRSHENLSIEEYQPYFEQFYPDKFNPREWARKIREAGMKYVVLTAKHHDGFCLFDSDFTDYKVTNTPIGRDLIAEYVDAIRQEGLKVGIYFSIIDWYHPDYPKYHDLIHPMRGNPKYKDEKIDFDRYLSYMHHQVEELVTRYGKIDILWFDYSYEEMFGETWRATELVKMVRKYQPDVIMDNRLETSGEGFGSIVTEEIKEYSGDFVSPEQVVPYEGIVNYLGEPVPWEMCVTMNNHWAYNPNDHLYKSPQLLIRKLIECVAKNGNMILNVGPTPRGEFNQESQHILNVFGQWLSQHGESIYGCGAAGLGKPDWGYYTRKDNVVYAHIFEACIGPLMLPNLQGHQIKKISWLHDGSEVKVSDSWSVKAFSDKLFVELGPVPHFSYPLPNEIVSVLRIELVS